MAADSLRLGPGRAGFRNAEPMWQPRYYGLNLWLRRKVEEKLQYMPLNPVRAGLVEKAVDWKSSSARWYEQKRPVGIPIRWPPGLETDDAFTVSSYLEAQGAGQRA